MRAILVPFTRKPSLPRLAMAALLTWCLSCGGSAAEVRLSGTHDRIVLQTYDATILEILDALRSTFDLEVQLKGTTTRKFTGLYAGSLRQVLSGLLKREDYILSSAPNGISIRLLGKSAADSAAAQASLPSAAQGSRLIALRHGLIKRQGD